jgi:hypothetical protein
MKLILVTLVALVVGLMVACGEKPPPTPSYPQISEDEAVAIVKQHLQLISVGKTHCLAQMQSNNYQTGIEFTGKPERDGVWIVKNVPLRLQWFYTWKVYPITRTVELIERMPDYHPKTCP